MRFSKVPLFGEMEILDLLLWRLVYRVFKSFFVLFMKIDRVFKQGKDLIVQTAEHNIWVKVCWLAGQCERTFSV
jgi:hypothetical protein